MYFSAHDGGVANIVWLAGDTHVVSIGVSDHIAVQWRCLYDGSKEEAEIFSKKEEGAGDKLLTSATRSLGGQDYSDALIPRSSDIFGKVPQWRSALCPPTRREELDVAMVSSAESSAWVHLDHVHGIRLRDSLHSVRYNANGDMLFIVADVAVVALRDQQMQQLIYSGHKAATICLEVNSQGRIAASGDLSRYPEIHLWDACSAEPIATLRNIHKEGITCLSFNPSGDRLVSLGQDPHHCIAIHQSVTRNWDDGFLLATVSTSFEKMLWVLHLDEDEARFPISVGGLSGIQFFRWSNAGVERSIGVFGKENVIQPLLCAVVGKKERREGEDKIVENAEVSLLTGTLSGHIYEWRDGRVVRSVQAYDEPITAMAALGRAKGKKLRSKQQVEEGDIWLATGSGDGLVKIWSCNLKQLYMINIFLFYPAPADLHCHLLQCNAANSRLAIGVKSGELYETTLLTKSYTCLLQGHQSMQLMGLACNPVNEDEYATAGDDGQVIVWSISIKSCLRKALVEAATRCVVYSEDGKRLAVGLGGNEKSSSRDGTFVILEAHSLQVLYEDRKAKKAINDARWTSAAFNVLLFASADGKVYLHDAISYELLRTIAAPSGSSITHIDLSREGIFVRLTTADEELFDAKVKDGSIAANPILTQDVVWSSYHCPYYWQTQGTLFLLFLSKVWFKLLHRSVEVFNGGRVRHCDRCLPLAATRRGLLSERRLEIVRLPLHRLRGTVSASLSA